MTLEDTKNLFEQLLSKYFQNHPKLKDPAQVEVYHDLLEPYSPPTVKTAVLQCLREKRFFPDAAEVAVQCSRLEAPQDRAVRQDTDWLLRWWETEQLPKHRAAAVPTLAEALDQGMTVAEYNQLCKEAGL